MENTKMKRERSPARLLAFFLAISIIFILSLNDVLASKYGAPKSLTFGEQRQNVLKDITYYNPFTDSYPFTPDTKSVSFSHLYKSSKNLIRYLGEISHKTASSDITKKYDKFRTYGSDSIGEDKRAWAIETDTPVESTDDFHVITMAFSKDADFGAYFIYMAIRIFDTIAYGLIKILMFIRQLDLNILLDMALGTALSKQIKSLIFINPDTKAISPFLYMCIIFYILSFIGLFVRWLKGGSGTSEIKNELIALIAVVVVAAFSSSNTAFTSIAKLSIKMTNVLTNGITTSGSNNLLIYTNDTGDADRDAKESQMTLLDKPHIDAIIQAQFGVSSIDNLELNETNFGPNYLQHIEKTFSQASNLKNFEVSNGQHTVNNLGYFLYAANSGVDTVKPFKVKNSEITINEASPSRTLFVIDFLNYVLQDKSSLNDRQENIVTSSLINLARPNYENLILSTFIGTLNKIFLLLNIMYAIMFIAMGKIIMTIGVFFLPILPGLMLLKKTRDTGRKILMTYLASIVRVFLGELIISFILSITIILGGMGNGGMFLSFIFLLLFFSKGRGLYAEINDLIMRYEGFEPIRGMSRWYSNKVREGQRNKGQNSRRLKDRIKQTFSNKKANKGLSQTQQRMNYTDEKIDSLEEEKIGLQEERDKLNEDAQKELLKQATIINEQKDKIDQQNEAIKNIQNKIENIKTNPFTEMETQALKNLVTIMYSKLLQKRQNMQALSVAAGLPGPISGLPMTHGSIRSNSIAARGLISANYLAANTEKVRSSGVIDLVFDPIDGVYKQASMLKTAAIATSMLPRADKGAAFTGIKRGKNNNNTGKGKPKRQRQKHNKNGKNNTDAKSSNGISLKSKQQANIQQKAQTNKGRHGNIEPPIIEIDKNENIIENNSAMRNHSSNAASMPSNPTMNASKETTNFKTNNSHPNNKNIENISNNKNNVKLNNNGQTQGSTVKENKQQEISSEKQQTEKSKPQTKQQNNTMGAKTENKGKPKFNFGKKKETPKLDISKNKNSDINILKNPKKDIDIVKKDNTILRKDGSSINLDFKGPKK